jgi:TRAP-type transport system periplasmic protein
MKNRNLLTGCTVLTFVMALMLGWCSNAIASETPPAKKKIILKVAHHMQVNQAIQKVFEDLAKDVAAKTNGQVEMQIFGASQIGGLKDNTDALRSGTLEMGLTDLGTIATVYPKAGIGGLPFLFRDYGHVERVYDGPVGKQLTDEIVKATNIRFLGYTHSGFRSIISQKPIARPADAKNMRIRVPEIPMYLNTIKAFGANPTPIPLAEVYTSLQTGVVNGMECPNDILFESKLYEVTKYITRSKHIYSDNEIAINEKIYQSLPDDIKQILNEGVTKAVLVHRKAISDNDDKYYNALLGKGLKEVKPDIAAFKAAVKPVWDDFAKKQNVQNLIDTIVNTK